jgi:hypothetical protein
MASVIIGMDPHKRSVTIEVMNERENMLLGQRFGTDRDGFKELLRTGRRFPDRTWAIEGCNGIGRHVAQRLVAAGEAVVDVLPKLSARTQVFRPATAERRIRLTRTRSRWRRCARATCGSSRTTPAPPTPLRTPQQFLLARTR